MGKPAIEPRTWSPSRSPGRRGPWQENVALAGLELLPIPGSGPEDVAILPDGDVVTGLADGRICRLTPDGRRIEIVADTGGRPLGIEVRDDGRLVVCDAARGLLLVDPTSGTVEVLADRYDGRPFRFTNNAALHPDGSILFSDSSQRFGLEHFKADLLEHSETGRLLRWRDGEVEVVAEGLAFANGVALTHDGDAAWVAETGAYRISRVWLAGERAGQREVIVDNLPAFPDNLSTGPDGTVWVALPSERDATLDALLPRPPALRKVVWALPDALQPQATRLTFVAGFSPDGTLTHNLQGPGDRFHYVTGVRAHDRVLYLGSLVETAIARVPLPS
ncbi:MAG: SMP-30/gluconolactonase/LRE family protein [Nitriliruptoraceae bacterium]